MKVIIYQGLKKITIDHVAIPNIHELGEIMNDTDISEMNPQDLYIGNLRITSVHGQDVETFEMNKNEAELSEKEEGINWQQETIN